jgi:hypothetical protein
LNLGIRDGGYADLAMKVIIEKDRVGRPRSKMLIRVTQPVVFGDER